MRQNGRASDMPRAAIPSRYPFGLHTCATVAPMERLWPRPHRRAGAARSRPWRRSPPSPCDGPGGRAPAAGRRHAAAAVLDDARAGRPVEGAHHPRNHRLAGNGVTAAAQHLVGPQRAEPRQVLDAAGPHPASPPAPLTAHPRHHLGQHGQPLAQARLQLRLHLVRVAPASRRREARPRRTRPGPRHARSAPTSRQARTSGMRLDDAPDLPRQVPADIGHVRCPLTTSGSSGSRLHFHAGHAGELAPEPPLQVGGGQRRLVEASSCPGA